MKRRHAVPLLAGVVLAGCTTSPYDFPVPVMVDGKEAISMTGYMATDDETVVRQRLAKRMGCPDGTEFLSLATQRADNAVGTRILHYKAVMRCEADGNDPAHHGRSS